MAERQDPTAPVAGTAENGSDSPASGSADGSVVTRAEFEAAITEERKRRAGLERAHRMEMAALEKRNEELTTIALKGNQQPANSAVSLPELPEDSPFTPYIRNLYENTRQWQDSLTTRERVAEERRRMQDAMLDAKAQGVPEDELDDTSPETIRASAKDYLSRKTMEELRAEVRSLKGNLDKSVTSVRDEMGATRVTIATGPGQPAPEKMSAFRQLELVREEKTQFDRRGDGGNSVLAARAINRLNEWIKFTGGHEPMPTDWRPGQAVKR